MRVFVYVDSTIDDRPFYVGKGNDQRVKTVKRNKLHANIAKKHGQKRVIVFETMHEPWALEREVELIALLKTHHGLPGHWGANLTDGGEGVSGHVQTEEVRRKRSETSRGKPKSDQTKQRMRRPKTEEHQQALRRNLDKARVALDAMRKQGLIKQVLITEQRRKKLVEIAQLPHVKEAKRQAQLRRWEKWRASKEA